MAAFFNKLKAAGSVTSYSNGISSPKNKKEEPAAELTPLEKLLQNAGPLREDGSDKFFGLENFGNTCYCNSIVQALYYSESFRDNVVNYPPFSPPDSQDGKPAKVKVTIRPPAQKDVPTTPVKGQKGLTSTQALKQRQAMNGQGPPGSLSLRPEDKPDSPEYKKKQAMIKGPVLELAGENPGAYGMDESTFTGLKDIFTAMIESNTRTGVLSPQRFLEIFKRDNEMFRNSMHQDAHEFYGLVLNDVIASVEANARRMQEKEESKKKAEHDLARSVERALTASATKSRRPGVGTPSTGWVHDIFEGVLVSETRCLTCETTSQRDETFLDLSIDLEEHSSVTSCLQKFSAEEMLCERNKFHCDHCGGLQEAEKRMKIKKLPKVLALHLKRFKYTEDYSRLQKLFHRVVYPYYLRMFNTTDDAEDPDRMYELYAVVVHIGGNAYHGHYVSVIKTPDRGWLLFDDEMVEPVDKHFVRNFFGDRPGMACAYVLFYQETTFERMREEQVADGLEEMRKASQRQQAGLVLEQPNGLVIPSLSKMPTAQPTSPISPIDDTDVLAFLDHAQTAPGDVTGPVPPLPDEPVPHLPQPTSAPPSVTKEKGSLLFKSRHDKSRDKKQAKTQEKARKAAEREEAKAAEKKRIEGIIRMREARKKEVVQTALQESKSSKSTVEEEEPRRNSEAAVANGAAGKPATTDVVAANGEKTGGGSLLNRAARGSKSMSRKSFAFLAKDRDKDRDKDKNDRGEGSSTAIPPMPPSLPESPQSNGAAEAGKTPDKQDKNDKHDKHGKPPLKERFGFGLGKKRSERFLS